MKKSSKWTVAEAEKWRKLRATTKAILAKLPEKSGKVIVVDFKKKLKKAA